MHKLCLLRCNYMLMYSIVVPYMVCNHPCDMLLLSSYVGADTPHATTSYWNNKEITDRCATACCCRWLQADHIYMHQHSVQVTPVLSPRQLVLIWQQTPALLKHNLAICILYRHRTWNPTSENTYRNVSCCVRTVCFVGLGEWHLHAHTPFSYLGLSEL